MGEGGCKLDFVKELLRDDTSILWGVSCILVLNGDLSKPRLVAMALPQANSLFSATVFRIGCNSLR